MIGEIRLFAGDFEPRGWAFCDGQLLEIIHYPALFSVIGTLYGGDGRVNFGVPDLRGRVPLHYGEGPGLTEIRLGEKGGAEKIRISREMVPGIEKKINKAILQDENNSLSEAQSSTNSIKVHENNPVNKTVEGYHEVGKYGISLQQPYFGLNFIICLVGEIPVKYQ